MQDWAIRTMARNCTDQWRRSMAAHLGTLAQPRFVQDPMRDVDRLLASRAVQLDAAIPPPGEPSVQVARWILNDDLTSTCAPDGAHTAAKPMTGARNVLPYQAACTFVLIKH